MSLGDFLEDAGDGMTSIFAPVGVVALGILLIVLAAWLHTSDAEKCQTACGSHREGVLMRIDNSDSTCICKWADGSYHTPSGATTP